jgi:hypothetical protein
MHSLAAAPSPRPIRLTPHSLARLIRAALLDVSDRPRTILDCSKKVRLVDSQPWLATFGPVIASIDAVQNCPAITAKGARAHLSILPDINHYALLHEWRTLGACLLAQLRSLTAAWPVAASILRRD